MAVNISEDGEPFYSEGFVVRFFKADGTSWTANFNGCNQSGVFELTGTENLLLLTCGKVFIMDVEQTEPVDVFGDDISSYMKFLDDGRLLLYDWRGIYIVESNGKYQYVDLILDDLEVNDVKGDIVYCTDSGGYYTPDGMASSSFTYNLSTNELKFEEPPKGIKPWWKFW